MAEYGLGNFLYELTVDNGSAKFKFRDPDDASNTAETSVSQKDFPEGVVKADSRQVADQAFFKVSKELNDKRDARLKRERAKADEEKTAEDARAREAADKHIADSEEPGIQPVKVESDGTRVYNTEVAEEGNKKK